MSFLKLSVEDNIYIYDSYSHDFYQLENLKEDFLKLKQQSNLFKEIKLKNFSIQEDTIRNNLINAATLILETTEKCNLRCSYCVFSDDFKGEREHTNIPMATEIAINAINDFSERSKEPYIVFYGGEPLMNIPLIKASVAHANKLFTNAHYSMTTNGTLLRKNLLPFLIENNFKITVSLDGLKHIHDKYRTFSNGQPSWDIILSNLTFIKNQYPDFYNKNIGFNCVVPNDIDIEEVNSFFNTHELFQNHEFRFSYTIQSANDYQINEINKNRIIKILQNKEMNDNVFDLDHIGTLIQKVIYRKDSDTKKVCTPFSNRTFVRTNGDLQFCERIGDNYGRAKTPSELVDLSIELNREYNEFVKEDCSNCWAYRFCEQCPASIAKDGALDKIVMRKKCNNFKQKMKFSIEMYIHLMLTDEELLNHI